MSNCKRDGVGSILTRENELFSGSSTTRQNAVLGFDTRHTYLPRDRVGKHVEYPCYMQHTA